MYRIQTIESAKTLAREMLRIESIIQHIIHTKEFNFDVFHDEELGWIIQTSYCQMGGCAASYISSDCEESANLIAAEMTLRGLKPDYHGICSSCKNELYEMEM